MVNGEWWMVNGSWKNTVSKELKERDKQARQVFFLVDVTWRDDVTRAGVFSQQKNAFQLKPLNIRVRLAHYRVDKHSVVYVIWFCSICSCFTHPLSVTRKYFFKIEKYLWSICFIITGESWIHSFSVLQYHLQVQIFNHTLWCYPLLSGKEMVNTIL